MKKLVLIFFIICILCSCSYDDVIKEKTDIVEDNSSNEYFDVENNLNIPEKPDMTKITVQPGHKSVYDNPIEYYGYDAAINIINTNSKYKVSDECFIKIPSKVSHVCTFIKSFPATTESLYEYYLRYLEDFKYLFGDYELNDSYLYWYGKNSNYQAEGGFKKLNDYEMFMKQNPKEIYYMFYSAFFGNKDARPEKNIFLESSIPVGCGLSSFNKGVCAQVVSEQMGTEDTRFLETYLHPSELTGFNAAKGDYNIVYPTKEYLPSSDEMVTLLDGKRISICDAVNIFENYVNKMPIPREPLVDNSVMRVSAVQIKDTGESSLYFLNTQSYEGIPFDYKPYGTMVLNGNDSSYEQLICSGYMAVIDDVDAAYGYGREVTIDDREEYEDIVSFEQAVKCCSENMSDYAEWELLSAEFVYCAKEEKKADENHQGMMYGVRPFYKFVIYNENDGLEYAVYIDAITGDFTRYYPAKGYHM